MTGQRPQQRKTGSRRCAGAVILSALLLVLFPETARAIQLHVTSEGIITHQIGHTFFFLSMGVLIFTIRGKPLGRQKGWKMIQLAALFFMLWNLDTLIAHFLDNQIKVVATRTLSFSTMEIQTSFPAAGWVYYVLKLDHLLCVPAMFFLFRGVSILAREQETGSETGTGERL